jgi:hypothetical protein
MEKTKEQKERLIEEETLPQYESPKVITYSGDELLAKLCPAQACNPFTGAVIGC